jgi:hypothetical protein
MSGLLANLAKSERGWNIALSSIYVVGLASLFSAVPILFGDQERDWVTTLVGIPIGVLIAAITLRVLRPATFSNLKWSVDETRRPALTALKTGAIVAVTMFLVGLALITEYTSVSTEAHLPAAITFGLAMGAWSALWSYLMLKLQAHFHPPSEEASSHGSVGIDDKDSGAKSGG